MLYRSFLRVVLVVLGVAFSGLSYGQGEKSGPVYDAIDALIQDLTANLDEFAAQGSKSALISISTSENLAPDVREFFIKRIEGVQKGEVNFRFTQCKECLSLRAETEGESVFIKKGVTSTKDLLKYVQPLGVGSYTEVSLIYTGTKLSMLVNTYQLANQSLLLSKNYSKRVLHLSKTGLKFSLTFGQFVRLSSPASYPFGGTFDTVERVYGFGEFGLGIMGYGDEGTVKSYYALGPVLKLNFNELMGKPLSWGAILFVMRAHYGWYGSHRDIMFGMGLKTEIGTLFHVTLDLQQGISLESETKQGSKTTVAKENASPLSLMVGFGVDFG